jgi:hypothetical protein
MKGVMRINAWPVILASLVFLTHSYCFAELPLPEFSIVEIETQSTPNWVAHTRDGSTQYLVVVEPFLVEVFGFSPGRGLALADLEPSDALLGKGAIGYFNDDVYWDLAVTESLCGRISIWLGDEGGTLDYYGSFETQTPTPDRVETGDFDEDGADDLLLTDFCGGKLVVMLNDGQGNFSYHTEYSDGAGHQEAAVADFNGDGHLDYIVTTQTYNESIQRFGDGTGYFYVPQEYSIGSDGYTSSLTDMDGDGIDDYICGTGRDIRIFMGKPDGMFRKSSCSFGFGFGPIQYRSVVGDFNGDEYQDVCSFITGIYGETMGELQFWYGDGTGNLYPTERMFVEGVQQAREVWPVAADLNNDQKTDFFITCDDSNDPLVRAYIMQ